MRVDRPPRTPAKRQRRTREEDDETVAADDGNYTDIKVHAGIVSARSAYFDRALSGEWAEAAERRVELTLEDEQELEDLKLLIKLAYTDSYTRDGGKLLSFDTRLWLIARANALEFVEAMDELVGSLLEGLTFLRAMTCLEGLPPAVEQHARFPEVRSKALKLLVKGIERKG